MTDRHDELRDAIGAYVLGQLDGPLLAELEEHLTTCAACRAEAEDLAGLAVPLRGVSPELVDALVAPVPTGLDARVDAALAAAAGSAAEAESRSSTSTPSPSVTPLSGRRPRAGGWRPALVGALAGAAAAAVVAVAVWPDAAPTPTVIAVRDVSTAAGVTATAGLVDHTWGVELKLVATGLPAGRSYDVRIVDDEGRAYDSGAFIGVDRTVTCSMNASVLLAHAERFEVVAPGGDVVISGPIAS